MSAPEPTSIDTLLSRVEKSSADFAERATLLSETIERVAATLIEMPGKTESRVSDDGGEVELAFDKLPTWNLWVIDPECEPDYEERRAEPLANVSILRKNRAFPLLTDLLADIEEKLKSQVAEIDNAMNSFDRASGKRNAGAPKRLRGEKASGGSTQRPQPVAKEEVNDDLPF